MDTVQREDLDTMLRLEARLTAERALADALAGALRLLTEQVRHADELLTARGYGFNDMTPTENGERALRAFDAARGSK